MKSSEVLAGDVIYSRGMVKGTVTRKGTNMTLQEALIVAKDIVNLTKSTHNTPCNNYPYLKLQATSSLFVIPTQFATLNVTHKDYPIQKPHSSQGDDVSGL